MRESGIGTASVVLLILVTGLGACTHGQLDSTLQRECKADIVALEAGRVATFEAISSARSFLSCVSSVRKFISVYDQFFSKCEKVPLEFDAASFALVTEPVDLSELYESSQRKTIPFESARDLVYLNTTATAIAKCFVSFPSQER